MSSRAVHIHESLPKSQFCAVPEHTRRPQERDRSLGFCFRSAALDYALPEKLVNGLGAQNHGGRWNAPGSFRCVYLSATGAAAYTQSLPVAQRHGLNDALVQPRVVIAIELVFQRFLNLPALAAQTPQIDLKSLISEDWRSMNDRGQESNSQAFVFPEKWRKNLSVPLCVGQDWQILRFHGAFRPITREWPS